MRLLVGGTTRTLRDLAPHWGARLGHLLTPAGWHGIDTLLATGLPWAVDNGAFSGFDPLAFRRLLARCARRPRCLWVACPDVVGDARATLARFGAWREEIAAQGFPVALVGQDGAEACDIPWDAFDAWFVGGGTRWKLSQSSADLCGEAKRRGKWVHLGRCNSLRRLRTAAAFGADSVDGSSLSRFGDTHLPKFCRGLEAIARARAEPALF